MKKAAATNSRRSRHSELVRFLGPFVRAAHVRRTLPIIRTKEALCTKKYLLVYYIILLASDGLAGGGQNDYVLQ